MTRVALTDPNRTRAMVEEDAANVETLLRNMANRLTLVANVLHDMADTGVRPTEGDVKQMDRFFTQGQPFRDYKAASRQPEYDSRKRLAAHAAGIRPQRRAYRAIRRRAYRDRAGAFRGLTTDAIAMQKRRNRRKISAIAALLSLRAVGGGMRLRTWPSHGTFRHRLDRHDFVGGNRDPLLGT